MRRLVMLGAGGVKSIPLNAMLQQTQGWQSLLGGEAAGPGTPGDYYRRVPWLYRAVNLTAQAVGTLPLRFVRGETEIEDTGRALPWMQSFGDLVDGITGDLLLYGAAYVFLGRNARGLPTEMRRLLPATITPKFDELTGLTHFERRIGGQTLRLDLRDVVYVWLPNRSGETGPGASPAQAALAAAGILANIDTTAENLFANGAVRPTVAFMDDALPDGEIERVESYLNRKLRGVKEALGIVGVSKKVEFATVGDPPDNLAMPELTATQRENVATALGVPQTLLFSNAANYATANSDNLSFYDLTVIPYARRILSAFNTQLFDAYRVVAETAENELELYQQMQGDQVTALAAMRDRGVITVNEFRERVGLPPLEEVAPEPAPLVSEADEGPSALPEPDETAKQRDELRTWKRYALKRLHDGKAGRPFKPEHVAPTLAAAIEGQIAGLDSADALRAVFDNALLWTGYP